MIKNFVKKILLSLFSKKILSLGVIPLIGDMIFFAIPLAAFEAHVISVTARIENKVDAVGGEPLELEVPEASQSAEPIE